MAPVDSTLDICDVQRHSIAEATSTMATTMHGCCRPSVDADVLQSAAALETGADRQTAWAAATPTASSGQSTWAEAATWHAGRRDAPCLGRVLDLDLVLDCRHVRGHDSRDHVHVLLLSLLSLLLLSLPSWAQWSEPDAKSRCRCTWRQCRRRDRRATTTARAWLAAQRVSLFP
jgi:hypothetical protein